MTPEQWKRVEDECSSLRDAPESRRLARLEELKRLAPDIAATVERMLAADVSPDFLKPLDDEAPASPPRSTFPALKDFRVIREIGQGGMGVVYLAEDHQLRRMVALKVLSPAHEHEERAVRHFRKEAQAIARLRHPNIVQIYRYGEEHGLWFIAMEYIAGETLATRFRMDTGQIKAVQAHASDTGANKQEKIDPATGELLDRDGITRYVRLIAEVADGLEHAHQQGVIHRDVKPANVLIDDEGHARLADFGIARVASDASVSVTENISGTFQYMSPEQAKLRSIKVDHRTDIFSLGVVLYELLTLHRPFGDELGEVLRRLDEGEPTAIRRQNPDIHRDLAVICHKAIEKLPEHRYQSAAHMAADLRSWLNYQPIMAHPPSLRRRVTRWVGRRRGPVAVTAMLLLAIAVGSLLYLAKASRDAALAWVVVESRA